MEDHHGGGTALGKVAHGLQNGVLVQGGEHRRRLVKQQRLTLGARPELSQNSCQVNTLPLATRQRQVSAPDKVQGIGGVQCFGNDFGVAHLAGGMG
ncbi:hypothetical protein D3C80_1468570 [compost metagenome]